MVLRSKSVELLHLLEVLLVRHLELLLMLL
jgi:hypothetical protein